MYNKGNVALIKRLDKNTNKYLYFLLPKKTWLEEDQYLGVYKLIGYYRDHPTAIIAMKKDPDYCPYP